MSRSEEGLTRRGLLTGLIGGTAAAVLSPRLARAEGKARVIRVESDRVWRDGKRDPKMIAAMVERGVMAFAGETSREAAWRRFFKPGMRVGLKINLLGRPFLFTSREVTEAVAAGVLLAGVKPADLIVWDRYPDHFPPTDYTLGPGSLGETIAAGGSYDAARGFAASGGHVAIDTIPLDRTDVTVNLPVLKDHGTSGVTLALKNIAFGCYQHHDRAHESGCDPYIAEACRHFYSVAKVPLIILDATRACYEGGPRPADRNRIWNENAIYVATDPVALDVTCRRVIMTRRVTGGLSDKTRQCRHIETAAGMGLGVGDPARIDVTTVKV